MYQVKKQYVGKTALSRGGRTFVFPSDGSNPFNIKTCEKFPQFFEVSDSKPPRRKSSSSRDRGRDNQRKRSEVGKMGKRQGKSGGAVSAKDGASLPKQQDTEVSIDSASESSGKSSDNGVGDSAAQD